MQGRNSKLSGVTAIVGSLPLVCCGQPAADVVAGTEHCSTVSVAQGLLVRLSRHYGSGDSVPLRVVQVCRAGGGCEPALTYSEAPPPLVSIGSQGALVIELLGGRVIGVHRRDLEIAAGRSIPVEVRHIRGGAADQRERFLGARTAPNRLDDRDCDRPVTAPAAGDRKSK